MKYTVQVEINVPRDKVLELFDNPENMAKWQEGFVSLEHLSGEPGQVGAKSKLKYLMGSREIEMIETITVRNLPEEFSGTYEAKGVWNEVRNLFSEKEGKTLWVSHNEFRCTGFMWFIALIFPGTFRKQSQKYLDDFKKFAENQ